jgi:hypothetical protein
MEMGATLATNINPGSVYMRNEANWWQVALKEAFGIAGKHVLGC